jgi:hypothetical protein
MAEIVFSSYKKSCNPSNPSTSPQPPPVAPKHPSPPAPSSSPLPLRSCCTSPCFCTHHGGRPPWRGLSAALRSWSRWAGGPRHLGRLRGGELGHGMDDVLLLYSTARQGTSRRHADLGTRGVDVGRRSDLVGCPVDPGSAS